MIEGLVFFLWFVAIILASIPAVGRWVFVWILRINFEGTQLLETWTQNLLRLQLV